MTARTATGDQTFTDPGIQLARALFALGIKGEATQLIHELAQDHGRDDPRTCDMVAEVLTEVGDLAGALDWATAGVTACMQTRDRDELPLLLRRRYRIRLDLGLPQDDHDKALAQRDRSSPTANFPGAR